MDFYDRMQNSDRLRRHLLTGAFLASLCIAAFAWYRVVTGNGLTERERLTLQEFPLSMLALSTCYTIPAFMTGFSLWTDLCEHYSSQAVEGTEANIAPEDLQPAPLVNLSFQIPSPEQRAKLHRLIVERVEYCRMTRNFYVLVVFCTVVLATGMWIVAQSTVSITIRDWQHLLGRTDYLLDSNRGEMAFVLTLLGGKLLFLLVSLYAATQMMRRQKGIRNHLAELLKTSPHPCLIDNALYYFRAQTDKEASEVQDNIANILHSMRPEQVEISLPNYKIAFKKILRSAGKNTSNPNLVRATLHAVTQFGETSLLPIVRYVANRGISKEVRQEAKACSLRLEAVLQLSETSETLLRPAYAVPTSELLRPAYNPTETQESQKLLLKPSDAPRKEDDYR
ncbi:MAG: hypothetical protein NT023_07195 [Armatimonadetes bacterium]|nr:hypothetical protein [Armatimonadota bacterium]